MKNQTTTTRNEDLVIRCIVSKLNTKSFITKEVKVSNFNFQKVCGIIGNLVRKGFIQKGEETLQLVHL